MEEMVVDDINLNEAIIAKVQSMGLPTVVECLEKLEVEMLKHEQVECPVYHHFSPGIYIREINMKADTFAMGHWQKTEHLNVFLKGRVSMVNDDGTVSELQAPMIFVGKPGKKCGYIREDVVWLNIYPTDETDIEKLEEMFLDKDVKNWKERPRPVLDRTEDREDYISALTEYGFSEDDINLKDDSDVIRFPFGTYSVAVSDSCISGKGLFATANIKEGDPICPIKIGWNRTPAGRFINHAKNPNSALVVYGDDIHLCATRNIDGMHGGELGEEITMDYRKILDFVRRQLCQQR